MTTVEAAVPIWAPLRVSSYRYLLTGQATSLIGDQLLIVAVPFIVLGHGAGAIELGKIFAAYGVARVIALPLGGWLGDRYARRVVMLASDLVRAVLVLGLFITAGAGFDVTRIAMLMGLVGLAEGAFLPASYAILPSTVPADLLGRANGLSSGAQNLALLVGPGLGGLLAAALDPRWCLGVDVATFAVSIATLVLLRTRPSDEPEAVADRGDTVRFFAGSRLLRVAITLTLVSNLAYYGMLEVALPVLSKDVLKTAAYGYGIALAAFGLGSMLGGLGIARLERRTRRGLIACGIGVAQGAFFAAIAVPVNLAVTAALMALAGLTCGVLNVFYLSRIQEHIPDRLLGRAMSLLMLAVFAIHPISVAAAGQIAEASGPALVFGLAGLSIAIAFVAGSLTRTYREL